MGKAVNGSFHYACLFFNHHVTVDVPITNGNELQCELVRGREQPSANHSIGACARNMFAGRTPVGVILQAVHYACVVHAA